MESIRVAQLASFKGNLGDTANVLGLRKLMREVWKGVSLEFTDIEYLGFDNDPRWGGRTFDASFVELVNRHDLLIVGGGGFFELSRDDSATGTVLDFSDEVIDAIRIPIVFQALGVEVAFGTPESRLANFRRFLGKLVARDDVMVSVRNDGSLATMTEIVGIGIARKITEVPDGGFFATDRSGDALVETPRSGRRIVAMNLAGDYPWLRFPEHNVRESLLHRALCRLGIARPPSAHEVTGEDRFLQTLGTAWRSILDQNQDVELELVPHLPEDFKIIGRFIELLGPPYSRSRIAVAAFGLGDEAVLKVLEQYSRCDLVVGMRFHASVCSIGLGVPTLGLASAFQKIEGLYSALGMESGVVRVDEAGFAETLMCRVQDSLDNLESYTMEQRSRCQRLRVQEITFLKQVRQMVEAHSPEQRRSMDELPGENGV